MDGRCPKRCEGAVASLPDDAVVEILSRLPAKSLCRSKCVSKAWCGLITDRLRCSKLPQKLEGFFYGGVEVHYEYSSPSSDSAFTEEYGSEEDELGREDIDKSCGKDEDLSPYVNGHFINLMGRSSSLVDPSFSFLSKQPEIGDITLLDSCNGLLLFGHTGDTCVYGTPGYVVCNPATEHWVCVPNSDIYSGPFESTSEDSDSDNGNVRDTRMGTYLIFDPVTSSNFGLIELCRCNSGARTVRTYYSKTKRWHRRFDERYRWKRGGEWDLLRTITSMRGSTVFHRKLHLIISPFHRGPELIAVINVKGETRRIIQWPENRGFPVFVGQSKGLLHCLSVTGHPDVSSCHMTELSIWVLEDYRAKQWNLKHTVSFSEIFGRKSCQFGTDYNVVTIHPDHNLVFFVQHWDYKLISYDMDRKEVCAICNVGCDYRRIFPYVPYFSESHVLSEGRGEERRKCWLSRFDIELENAL